MGSSEVLTTLSSKHHYFQNFPLFLKVKIKETICNRVLTTVWGPRECSASHALIASSSVLMGRPVSNSASYCKNRCHELEIIVPRIATVPRICIEYVAAKKMRLTYGCSQLCLNRRLITCTALRLQTVWQSACFSILYEIMEYCLTNPLKGNVELGVGDSGSCYFPCSITVIWQRE